MKTRAFVAGAFLITLLAASAQASTPQVEMRTQPEAFRPNVVLNDVQGAGNNRVIEVTLEFPELDLSVPMRALGGRSWKAELSDEQLAILKKGGESRHAATVVIKTRNDKRRVEKTKKQIEVVIDS